MIFFVPRPGVNNVVSKPDWRFCRACVCVCNVGEGVTPSANEGNIRKSKADSRTSCCVIGVEQRTRANRFWRWSFGLKGGRRRDDPGV